MEQKPIYRNIPLGQRVPWLSPEEANRAPVLNEAVEFLLGVLAPKPRPVCDVMLLGRDADILPQNIYRASALLEVVKRVERVVATRKNMAKYQSVWRLERRHYELANMVIPESLRAELLGGHREGTR